MPLPEKPQRRSLLLEFSNNFSKLFAYGAFFNAFPKQGFQAGSGALQKNFEPFAYQKNGEVEVWLRLFAWT